MATGGVPEISKGPSTIYWYLTNTCNQRCAHCWVTAGAEFGQRALRLAELREFFDDAIASGLKRIKLTVAGLLVLTHHVKIPAFIVIGFLMGCGQVISNAARTANVPLLAAASRQGITRLNARIKTIRGAATLLGHPLDGFLVATVGAAPALFLDAFSYGFAASCSVWAFQLLPGYPAARIDKGPEYIARVLHGLRFIFQHRLLRILVIQSAASNMLLTPLTGIILTILAKESWHSSRELGIVLGAIGLGALAGGIAISSRPALIPGIRLYGLLVLGASLPLCAFLTGNFYLMVTGAFIAGIANVFVNIAGDTAMQRAVPADLRGRVFAPVVSALAGVVPIGTRQSASLSLLCSGGSAPSHAGDTGQSPPLVRNKT